MSVNTLNALMPSEDVHCGTYTPEKVKHKKQKYLILTFNDQRMPTGNHAGNTFKEIYN